MGLDIEALRKKMQEVKEGQNRGGGADFWTPKDGRNVIRILPAKEGADFYAEAKVRYNVGPNKKMVTVPLDSSKDNCPIHAFVDALYKTKEKDDEALAKRMKASSRYYFNIIDRSVEEGAEGYGDVLVFGCGSTIFTDILGIICDPDYGDITDPENGYDIIITKSGKKLDTEYKTNARPKQTPIGIADWKEKLNDLAAIAKPKSYEKREEILSGVESNNNEEESKGDTKTSVNSDTSEKKADNPAGVNTNNAADDDIEAEIQAMLKENQ